MAPSRRDCLPLAAAALAVFSSAATAQKDPTRPVRIIAAFAAGGGVDITARLIGQWLSSRLGQSFVTENRPGAGGNLGTEAVVNAPPDGHTLLLATSPNAVNATLYEKLNFNFIRDIAPVAGIIDILNREINAALVDPGMKARLADLGGEPLAGSPSEFGKFIAEETEKWGAVVKVAGIKPE